MRFRPITGFRDFYPAEMAARRAIEAAWHGASRAAGYQEIDGPVLEDLDLLRAKSGDEVGGQLFAFETRGGREVALRAEMTPTLARMVGARANALPKPIKWYCVPQFFRHERPQRGRGREFLQWNVDVIGAPEAAADAETIAVALDALHRLGLEPDDYVVRVSDRRLAQRLLESIEIGSDRFLAVLACIDKLERDPGAAARMEELVGEKRAREVRDWCDRFPLDAATELHPLLEACDDLGVGDRVEPDFKIARGFDYYTATVFEIFDARAKLRSVAGGGRYDDLVRTLGGPDLPATGFGMGDMVLGELLRERGLAPPVEPRADVFVVPIGAEMERPARRVLAELRRRGLRADGPYTAPRVARALRAADAAGARRAVLVGPDEWAQGRVRVKDLESGEERSLPVEEIE